MSEFADFLTGPNAQFLRKTTLVPKLFEKMNPYLAFPDMFPAIGIDSRAAIMVKEQYNADADPGKVWPAHLTAGSDWPNVTISAMQQDSAILQKYGLELKIHEDTLNLTEGFNVIDKGIGKIGYWFAQFLNSRMASQCIANGTNLSTNWAPTAAWSDDARATPIEDLVKFKRSMRRSDAPYVCTDIFVNSADYDDLELFLIDANADLAKRQQIGSTTVGEDSVYIPALRGTVHRVDTGISESGILGLDKANPCGTYYYFNDPKYGVGDVTYNARDASGSGVVEKTVPSLGLSTHQYFNDNTHEIITQFWFDSIFVVEDAYGAIYDTGI